MVGRGVEGTMTKQDLSGPTGISELNPSYQGASLRVNKIYLHLGRSSVFLLLYAGEKKNL